MSYEEQFKDSLRKLMESKEFPFDEANWEKAQEQLPPVESVFESQEEIQLKASLQNLVESKEFAFDESNWDKAAGLLPSVQPSLGRLLLYAALLLLLPGTLAYFYFTGENTVPVKTVAGIPASKPIALPKTQAITAPANLHSSQTIAEAATLPKEPAAKPNLNLMAGSLLSSPAKASASQPEVKTPPSHISSRLSAASAAAGTDITKTPVAKTNPVADPVILKETNAAVTRDPLTETQAPSANTPATPEPVKTPDLAGPEKQNDNAAPAETAKLPDVNAVPPAIAETSLAALPAVQNAEQQAAPVTEAPKETAVSKPDSAAVATNSMSPLPVHKKIIMSFEAGADYLAGWKNSGKTDANGFNPIVGFNYYNYLTDKLAVSFGAQYTAVNNLSAYSHVSKITQFDLGAESSVTVITPQKLHYIAVPVKLNYFVNDNNSFGAGVTVAYLLTADSKVETYTESLGKQSNYKSYKTSGYTEGLSAFDTQLSVFYRRRIYKNLSVNAELVYGLTDIKNNGFFGSNTTERNTGIKLTLLYNLFK